VTDVDTNPLRRLTAALGSAITSDEVAHAILQHGLRELGALAVSLWLIGDDGAALEYAGGAGAITGDVSPFVSLPLDADLPGTIVVSTREPIVYRSTSERNARWPDLEQVQSVTGTSAILPLNSRGEVIGCLSVGFGTERDIDSNELAQLMTAADQCALAIDRARLLDREREARRTLEFLAEATRLMIGSLDPVVVLDQLLSHAVPLLADWCCVFVHDGGVLRRTAVKIADDEAFAARILHDAPAIPLTSNLPVSSAWLTGSHVHVPAPTAELARDLYDDLAPDVIERGWHDLLACPIKARGNRVGVITFAFMTSDRRYDAVLFAMASGLAARAGVALDVARRFERERTTAATLVAAVLPERLPRVDGWSIDARYMPAGDAVCGDWYDVTSLPDGQLLVGVGDAAGHGLTAATLMAELRNAARGLAFAGHSPIRLLDDLSALAALNAIDSFATGAYGRLDPATGVSWWALAGHPPPLLIRSDEPPQFMPLPTRPPLGIECPESVVPQDRQVVLQPGDALVLYTDGLVERRRSTFDAGLARLVASASGPVTDAVTLADKLVDELCTADMEDDCSILVIYRDKQ
jgi:GAF domain-containing protein